MLGRLSSVINFKLHWADEIVAKLVSLLKIEHESWIAVFNRRATTVPKSLGTTS